MRVKRRPLVESQLKAHAVRLSQNDSEQHSHRPSRGGCAFQFDSAVCLQYRPDETRTHTNNWLRQAHATASIATNEMNKNVVLVSMKLDEEYIS